MSEENVFMEGQEISVIFRQTKYFRRWVLWLLISLAVMIFMYPITPTNLEESNEASMFLSLGFLAFWISIDRLFVGFQYKNRGVIQ